MEQEADEAQMRNVRYEWQGREQEDGREKDGAVNPNLIRQAEVCPEPLRDKVYFHEGGEEDTAAETNNRSTNASTSLCTKHKGRA